MSVLHAKENHQYKVVVLCRLFGRSKQAYYKRDDNLVFRDSAMESFAIDYVRSVRAKAPGIGICKLWHMYRRDFEGNSPLGRDRFYGIMDREGMKLRKKRRKPRTTDSRHGLPTYPDLREDFMPSGVNQLWVSDITYIEMWTGAYSSVFCYLSLVMDAYSMEIIGYSVGPTLETSYPLEALRMAFAHSSGEVPAGLIHHSDRGVQYASREYVGLLESHGVKVSMTQSGNPKDNAQAERVNGTMKNELLKGYRFKDIGQVREAVGKSVEFYNNDRPHMSVDMMTPAQAAKCTGEINKRWRSYRLEAIKTSRGNPETGKDAVTLPGVQGFPSRLRLSVNP